jgi:hypothetical protein
MLRAWLGLTHDDWQRAYALLQFIMQVVTVEVCASLIFPAASAPPASPTMLVANNTHIDARGAIIRSLPLTVAAPQPNLNREANLDNTSECVDSDQTNLIHNVTTICEAWIGIRRVALRLHRSSMIIQRNALGSGVASCSLCRGRSLPPLHYLDRPHSRAKLDVSRLDRPRAVVRLQPAQRFLCCICT